jgi:SAM-dependent methyltransferase
MTQSSDDKTAVFGKYSSYYDLLYKDKDYGAETGYVHGLMQRYAPGAESILELGCGTGRHAFLLAQKGYTVTGVDSSEKMLLMARERASQLPRQQLNFVRGDIRDICLDTKFDEVIALFHVMSYQTTNEDLQAAFAAAAKHLRSGGIFVFDCWYGPGVLTDPPQVRVKRMEDDRLKVTRIAEPVTHPDKNTVDVGYRVFLHDKINGQTEELTETHRMRYLFSPEVESLASASGMGLMLSEEWMTGKPLGCGTWNACFVFKLRCDDKKNG